MHEGETHRIGCGRGIKISVSRRYMKAAATAVKQCSLHPKLEQQMIHMPASLSQFRNIILYGPQGVGKYAQAMRIIDQYSPSGLRMDKRMTVPFDDGKKVSNRYFRASDVHFEVDMGLLGVKPLQMWHELYGAMTDAVLHRQQSEAIVLCKNMHEIHSELLDIFYSYMQLPPPTQQVQFRYMFLTEAVGFLPRSILDACQIVPLSRPSASLYAKVAGSSGMVPDHPSKVSNIHTMQAGLPQFVPETEVLTRLVDHAKDPAGMGGLLKLRPVLYFMLTAWLSPATMILGTARKLQFTNAQLCEAMPQIYRFYRFYNNNYRPIFHLERLWLCLSEIHAATGSKRQKSR